MLTANGFGYAAANEELRKKKEKEAENRPCPSIIEREKGNSEISVQRQFLRWKN